MHRPIWTPSPSHVQNLGDRWRETWARLLTPLTLWICATVTLRYGYYGDYRMVLGPSSSRLLTASSLFVEQVQVVDEDAKGVFLYSFSEKPELSFETNWSISDHFVVGSNGRKGFSFWLNRGSRMSLRVDAPSRMMNRLETLLIRGEQKHETLLPKFTRNLTALALNESFQEGKQVEYAIEEDDRYRLDVINSNSRSIIITLSLNVSAKIYDISKAMNNCSTAKGSCQLRILFPYTHYVIITTPSNDHLDTWYIDLSFAARVVSYIAILGFITVTIFLILKYLGACDSNEEYDNPVVEYRHNTVDQEITETDPLLPEKPTNYVYGTPNHDADDEYGGSSSSSEDLYDAKLCVICYDEQRNCFFVPCGHCATCYDCAQRIMEGESRMCPICRRLIHRVRKLFNP